MLNPINNRLSAGTLAGDKVLFGAFSRYAVYPVHTRYDAVAWFVEDAERPDDLGLPTVIRQAATYNEATAGL